MDKIIATVIAKEPGKSTGSNKGKIEFISLPRIGEFIEFDVETAGQMYKVTDVIHSGTGRGVEVHVAYAGMSVSIFTSIFDAQQVPKEFEKFGE